MASVSGAVGLVGSTAVGKLPNFIKHAINNNRALVAVRLVPAMGLLAEIGGAIRKEILAANLRRDVARADIGPLAGAPSFDIAAGRHCAVEIKLGFCCEKAADAFVRNT
jgi:hypothetical protein